MAHNRPHIGNAVFHLYEVVPQDGRVGIRVHVGWETPIFFYANYLVINP